MHSFVNLLAAGVFVAPFAVAVTASRAPAPSPPPAPSTAALARASVERALPLLQSSGDAWFEKRACSSCHHQALGMMAVALAKERGIAVDTARLRNQVRRTSRTNPGWLERYVAGDPSINEAIGQSYRAVGLGAAGYAPTELTDAMVRMLTGKQHTSGRWSSYSRRPPLEDSEFTATAITIRALSLYARSPADAAITAGIARARTWLKQARAESTEDAAMQLFGLGWAGASAAEIAPFARQLMSEQRSDGGWSQITTRGSDVYATGQIVVALNQVAGLPMSDAQMQRAVRYLAESQLPDGSWHVVTRRGRAEGLPYFESGYPHDRDQFISYAGAAWATMALTLAQSEGRSTVLMGKPVATFVLPMDTSTFDDVTPLMWAAWRGTPGQMARLIAAGASVNDTTRSGFTALIFAARDAAKVKLLLDAGADANTLTRGGYTPLVLAAASDGSDAAARLLLLRGALPDVAGRTGSFTKATPMTLALTRGDTALASLLKARGADVRGVTGTSETPLLAATWYGDADMMRWLLARGATAKTPPPASGKLEQPSLLMIAAEDGEVDLLRELLADGAALDVVGPDGYTALQMAVSTSDRGSTEVVELLLKAGADPKFVAADGETALSLARKWATPKVVALIEAAVAGR